MRRALLAAAALALTACSNGDTDRLESQLSDLQTEVAVLRSATPEAVTAAPQPDTIVAIEQRCTALVSGGGTLDLSGFGTCHGDDDPNSDAWIAPGGSPAYINRRTVLTIRTADGRTYEATVSGLRLYELGAPWPPP